jgi:hypothetical protein
MPGLDEYNIPLILLAFSVLPCILLYYSGRIMIMLDHDLYNVCEAVWSQCAVITLRVL